MSCVGVQCVVWGVLVCIVDFPVCCIGIPVYFKVSSVLRRGSSTLWNSSALPRECKSYEGI